MDLGAEVAGATWPPLSLWQWRIGAGEAAAATWLKSPRLRESSAVGTVAAVLVDELHAAAGVRRKDDFSPEVVLRWGRRLLARRNADTDGWHLCAGADRRGIGRGGQGRRRLWRLQSRQVPELSSCGLVIANPSDDLVAYSAYAPTRLRSALICAQAMPSQAKQFPKSRLVFRRDKLPLVATFWRYVAYPADRCSSSACVGPIFLIIFFATQPDPSMKWAYWAGLFITAADVLIALALTNASDPNKPPADARIAIGAWPSVRQSSGSDQSSSSSTYDPFSPTAVSFSSSDSGYANLVTTRQATRVTRHLSDLLVKRFRFIVERLRIVLVVE